MALAIGLPVAFSQTTRRLALVGDADRGDVGGAAPALASAPATTASTLAQISCGVVLHPARPRVDLPVLLLRHGGDRRRPHRTACSGRRWCPGRWRRRNVRSWRQTQSRRSSPAQEAARKRRARLFRPGRGPMLSQSVPQGVRQRRRDVEDDHHEPCQRSGRPRRPHPHTPQLRPPSRPRLHPRRRHRLEAWLQGRHGGRLAAHGPVRAARPPALRRRLVEQGQHVLLLPPGHRRSGARARLRPS